MLKHLCFLAAACIGLSSCKPIDALNAVTPEGSIETVETFAYADGDRQSLDLYMPAEPKPSAPILIFIYGGGWDSGAKEDYKFAAESLTSAGYTVVVPDYRLYPEVIYPAYVEDAAMATAWTAKRFPGQPLVLIGHSAGAHSALMLALDTQFLSNQGIERCQTIAAAAGLSGPYGAQALRRAPFIDMFPNRMTGDDAPINNVTAKVPPVLLMVGLKDKTVKPVETTTMASALKAAGAAATLITYPDLGHADTAKLLADLFDDDGTVRADLLTFLEENSGMPGPYCGG